MNTQVKTIDSLNQLLADEFILFTKTWNYHWNVMGPNFGELHSFFSSQYDELQSIVDKIAERIRYLSGRAKGTLKEITSLAKLTESSDWPTATEMLTNLFNDQTFIVDQVKKIIIELQSETVKDEGTINILLSILEAHEKMVWMLRAYTMTRNKL